MILTPSDKKHIKTCHHCSTCKHPSHKKKSLKGKIGKANYPNIFNEFAATRHGL